MRSELVEVGGRPIEVVRTGSPPPSIVFLHEGLGSALQWRDVPERLGAALDRGTLAYSRFGYGRSAPVALPRPLTYMHDEAREVLPAVLDATGCAREVALFGHSDGASIAIMAAALDPRVRALVLEAPHVFVEDLSIASISKAKEAYATGDLRERLAKHHAHVDVAFRGWNDAWLDPGFRSWNIEEYLPRVAVPILVLQGEDDPYGTRAQVDAVAAKAAGRVDVVMLPACGHAPHRDQPEATLAAAAAFLRDSARQTR